MKAHIIVCTVLGLSASLTACKMKENVKNSPGGANSEYDGNGQLPADENAFESVRDALPANGAAATGTGITASNTSAASGAVNRDLNKGPVGNDGGINRPTTLDKEYNRGMPSPETEKEERVWSSETRDSRAEDTQ